MKYKERSNKLQVAGFRLPVAGQDFIHAQQDRWLSWLSIGLLCGRS